MSLRLIFQSVQSAVTHEEVVDESFRLRTAVKPAKEYVTATMCVYIVCFCNVCYLLFTHSRISIFVFIDFTHHFPELIWLYVVCGTYLLAKPSKLINYMTFLLFFPIFPQKLMGLIVLRTRSLHAVTFCAQAKS